MKNIDELKKWEAEFEKCKNSPVYFYNNYIRKEGQKEYTEQEYSDMEKMSRIAHIKARITQYPRLPSDFLPHETQ